MEVDGLLMGPPSMISGTFVGTERTWALVLASEWSSDLCDRIRREGVLRDSEVQVTTERATLSGRAWLEFEGEVQDGVVRIVVISMGGGSARPRLDNP
jgi:hypothetical protein